MTLENPYITDPTFVRASSIEEVDSSIKLLHFPDGFQFYSHSTPDEAHLIYNEVVVKREYLPPQIRVGDASCIFDVGGNVGVFTLFIKQMCKHAAVYVFEPIAETFSVLQKNLVLHDLHDVVSYNVAVGDTDFAEKDYTYYLYLTGNSTSNPSIHEPFKNIMIDVLGKEQADLFWASKTQATTVRTISSIIKENNVTNIDLLKIDVEGDEHAVLRGIEPEHYAMIKQVAIEVHSQNDIGTVSALLQEMGLTCFEGASLASSSGGGSINLYAVRNIG